MKYPNYMKRFIWINCRYLILLYNYAFFDTLYYFISERLSDVANENCELVIGKRRSNKSYF